MYDAENQDTDSAAQQVLLSTPTRRLERSPGGIPRSGSSAGLLARSPSRGLDGTAVVLPIQFGASEFS